MDGEEIRFCFKCEVSFSSFEDLSEHSCNALNSDAIDKKTEKNHDNFQGYKHWLWIPCLMMDGEEIGFCFKCQVSFSTFEHLSEHSCNILSLDAICVKELVKMAYGWLW